MLGPWFIRNDQLLPIAEAVVSLDDINFTYGYGVYESLKVRHRRVYFADLHEERLFHSARIIGVEHLLEAGMVTHQIDRLVEANQLDDANLKVLLIGSPRAGEPPRAQLSIIALNPLFPKRHDYRRGATAITVGAERQYPQAKSLNMMVSAIAYRRAQSAGAYDALLVDRDGAIREGTRTNFFVTDGATIYTPPADKVLVGVTRIGVIETIRAVGMSVVEADIAQATVAQWSGAFLTSTSSKVMPLAKIDDVSFAIPDNVRAIIQAYDRFLEDWASSR